MHYLSGSSKKTTCHRGAYGGAYQDVDIGSAYLWISRSPGDQGRTLIEGVPRPSPSDDSEIVKPYGNAFSTILNAIRVALERTPR